ncbi:CYTH domain-containing protein [Pontibacillus litoralis]|uniref:CYTH domain-containing protein n=1 Tax=Pontibacillus litoralis TaxID=516703 RepID=UPI00055D2F5E|nr:CYTH domain-containing protein [Pontibacillus litoralis]
MTQEIEIEFKNLLTEQEYEQLLQALPFDIEKRFTQTNYYFETTGFDLRAHGSALRIRKKNGTWTATLKEPHVEGLLETHDAITEEQAYQWMSDEHITLPNIQQRLSSMGIQLTDVLFRGSLLTERVEEEYEGTLIVLDRSHYNNKTDYELELEAQTKQHGEHIFNQLLTNYNIPKKDTPNKIQRFFQSFS